MRAGAAVVLLLALAGCQRGETEAPDPASAPGPARAPKLAADEPTPAPPAPAAPAPAPPPVAIPGATPYARDMARICRVEELAQVDANAQGINPMLVTAQYLAANLETSQARELVIQMNTIPSDERAALLDGEAVAVGLDDCPTARHWDSVP